MSDGIQYGPISFEAIKKIADNDKLKPTDFIRRSEPIKNNKIFNNN